MRDLSESQGMHFATASEWEAWLEKHHATTPEGVWLRFAKVKKGVKSFTYAEALDVALCYGWIDGQKGKSEGGNSETWLQRFTPRKAKSRWSQINRDKVDALIAAGRMKAPGLVEVDAAKKDGRWDNAYASQSNMQVPEDFQRMLDENPKAAEFFATLRSANRYSILFRIHDAKKPETRRNRMEKFLTMLLEGKTLH